MFRDQYVDRALYLPHTGQQITAVSDLGFDGMGDPHCAGRKRGCLPLSEGSLQLTTTYSNRWLSQYEANTNKAYGGCEQSNAVKIGLAV